jgi:hypothetical protein
VLHVLKLLQFPLVINSVSSLWLMSDYYALDGSVTRARNGFQHENASKDVPTNVFKTTKQTPLSESASELYRPSDRRLSAT